MQPQPPYDGPKDMPSPLEAHPPWASPPHHQGYAGIPQQPPLPQGYPPYQQWQQPYPPQRPMQQQQFAPPYPGQAPYPQYMQPPFQVQNIILVNVKPKGPNFLLRVLYFLFIGYWLGFFWLNLGYLLCCTIVLLPAGLAMLNRLPTVLTLRPASSQVNISMQGNVTMITTGGPIQYSFWIRTLYFVFLGSWLGYLWANLGYFLCLSLIGMPLGLVMLNRLPAVITLRRN